MNRRQSQAAIISGGRRISVTSPVALSYKQEISGNPKPRFSMQSKVRTEMAEQVTSSVVCPHTWTMTDPMKTLENIINVVNILINFSNGNFFYSCKLVNVRQHFFQRVATAKRATCSFDCC